MYVLLYSPDHALRATEPRPEKVEPTREGPRWAKRALKA